MAFQIYQETGLTPAPATRTAAVLGQASGSRIIDDKENKSLAAHSTAAAAGVNFEPEEEPMAVDWVKVSVILWVVLVVLGRDAVSFMLLLQAGLWHHS